MNIKAKNNNYKTLEKQERELQLKLLKIIWFAFFLSIIIYSLIGYFVGNILSIDKIILKRIENIFFFIGVGEVIFLIYVRRKIRNSIFKERENEKKFTIWKNLNIFSFAIAESFGIFGLILNFLGDSEQIFFIFLFASFLSLLMLFPTTEKFNQIFEEKKI